jgi:hypothetical protein
LTVCCCSAAVLLLLLPLLLYHAGTMIPMLAIILVPLVLAQAGGSLLQGEWGTHQHTCSTAMVAPSTALHCQQNACRYTLT